MPAVSRTTFSLSSTAEMHQYAVQWREHVLTGLTDILPTFGFFPQTDEELDMHWKAFLSFYIWLSTTIVLLIAYVTHHMHRTNLHVHISVGEGGYCFLLITSPLLFPVVIVKWSKRYPVISLPTTTGNFLQITPRELPLRSKHDH